MRKNKFLKFLKPTFLLLLILFITIHSETLKNDSEILSLTQASATTNEFREQKVSYESIEKLMKDSIENTSLYEGLAFLMLENNFDLTNPLKNFNFNINTSHLTLLQKYKSEEWNLFVKSYESIWSDLKYFPVPESNSNASAKVSFEDSWYCERSYGGERVHEGTDIIANIQKRGYYPILSITDGEIEKMGWLKMGGYRIGIRSIHGAYFYYAHLESYTSNLKVGDTIHAGDLIGYMGDTGYSEIVGTTGMFPVHLHLGIYYNPSDSEELSVNPYWILKYLENSKLKYSY